MCLTTSTIRLTCACSSTKYPSPLHMFVRDILDYHSARREDAGTPRRSRVGVRRELPSGRAAAAGTHAGRAHTIRDCDRARSRMPRLGCPNSE